MVNFICPKCKTLCSHSTTGVKVACPKCGQMLLVPAPASAPLPSWIDAANIPPAKPAPLAVPAAAATARAAAAVRPEPAPPARPSGRFPTMAGVVGVCLAIGCLVSGSLGFLLGRLTAPAPQQVASAPGPTGGTKDSTTHPASAAPKVEPPDNKKDAKPTADDSAPTPPAKPLPVKAKPYVANLANKNPDVRRTALLNLGAMGMDAEAAVPDVIRALDDP